VFSPLFLPQNSGVNALPLVILNKKSDTLYSGIFTGPYSGDGDYVIKIDGVDANQQWVFSQSVHISLNPIGIFARKIPVVFRLMQNAPNPFNPFTKIEFALPKRKKVHISIFDISGKKVRTLVKKALSAGFHEVSWDGRNDRGKPLSPGIYFHEFRTANRILIRKMLMEK